jgi:hypothetical protein
VLALSRAEARRDSIMNNFRQVVVGGALALATFIVVACGGGGSGDSGSGSESCGKSGRSGTTTCPGNDCSAGMHCEKVNLAEYACFAGCTSDVNCGENERCVKCNAEASALGSCQSCSKSEADICKPVVAMCERDTKLDQSCSTPGAKAYSCPSNMEPDASLGTCKNEQVAWCCGGDASANPCMRDNTFDDQFCFMSQAAPNFYECAPNMTAPATCESVMAYPGGYCCP